MAERPAVDQFHGLLPRFRVLVLFGILAGGQVAGFWGALSGIPTLAALIACLDHFRPRCSGQLTQ